MDQAALSWAFGGFFLFLLFHGILFRWTPQRLTAAIMIATILAGGILNLGGMVVTASTNPDDGPWFLGGAASLLLYALLVFHYIAWIFGMGEAAVRIRLLYEVSQSANGKMSLEEILEKYNGRGIMKIRLDRLVGSGHLVKEEQGYRMRSPALEIQLWITRFLRTCLGISQGRGVADSQKFDTL